MIIDSHSHAWLRWPYQPPVPDFESRGRLEQLLFEMDQNAVDRAVLVCARIDHNPDNNLYIADQVQRHRARIVQFADVDCSWWPTYHTPGAAARLEATARELPIAGFTHYLAGEDDGSWLHSDEGLAMFRVAADRNLIASISCGPRHLAALRKVAAVFPSVPFLIHHMGQIKANQPLPHPATQELAACAALPNMYVKVSGNYYTTDVKWNFPYPETHWIVKMLYEHFGPQRLCWGSDYPVVREFMTYRQAIEVFRTHCDFIPPEEQAWVLGKTLAGLLEGREPA